VKISRQCTESAQIFWGDLLVYKNLCTGKLVFLQGLRGEYAENALFLRKTGHNMSEKDKNEAVSFKETASSFGRGDRI